MEKKFETLRVLGWAALVGLLPLTAAMLLGGTARSAALTVGLFLVVPAIVFAYVLTILHWKARYQGRHSDFWGVVLIIETSGLFKIIYFFRHLLPDLNGWGRYRKVG